MAFNLPDVLGAPVASPRARTTTRPSLVAYQHIAVPELIQHHALQSGGGGRDRRESPSRFGKCDLVGARQVESERFRALYQFAQVSVAAEQILNQLGRSPCARVRDELRVAGECRDGVVHDQHSGGRLISVLVAFKDDSGKPATPAVPRKGRVDLDGWDLLPGGAPACCRPSTGVLGRPDVAAGEHRQVIARLGCDPLVF